MIFKKSLIAMFGLAFGLVFGYILVTYLPNALSNKTQKQLNPINETTSTQKSAKKEVLGFLPYWLLGTAQKDYSQTITTLDYFSLTIDKDGTILKSNSPIELEPGWYALTSGKADEYFNNAKAKNIKLSLTTFMSNQDAISELVKDPVVHADNFMNDISPVISKYGFSDLNLDIEDIQTVSREDQLNFQKFVQEIDNQIVNRNLNISLSIDLIHASLIRNDMLTYPPDLTNLTAKVIIMAYDFHTQDSYVTGPVAPLYGAGSIAEFDTQVIVNSAIKNFDSSKILLGLPFYGYTWETLDNFERAAVIPTTAQSKGDKDVEDLISKCTNCSQKFDEVGQESYVIYKNEDTGTYQQIFYTDTRSIKSKINFASGNNLGGVAIWALGQEAPSDPILKPIADWLKN